MGNRIRSRHHNGRYKRTTLADSFGLHNEVCQKCCQCHPYGIGEKPPETCVACGEYLTGYLMRLEREEDEQERVRAIRAFREMQRE